MIIDFHTHIFPPEIIANRAGFAARDSWFAELYDNPRAKMATAEDLIASMDANGVDRAVTFGFGWRDPGIIHLANEYVIDAISRFAGRLTGFAVAQPLAPDAVAEVERCADAGLAGIGELMPHGQGYRLSDVALLTPLITAARARDLIVLTHSSEPVGHSYHGKGDVGVADLVAFLTAFPGVRLVAAHWGGGLPFYQLMPEIAALTARCWLDTAASPYLYRPAVFTTAAASAGTERILWASDFPLIGHKRMLAYTRQGGLSDDDLALALGANAARLLGITPP